MTDITTEGSGAGPKAPWIALVLVACGLCYMAESFQAWAWPALDGYPAIERWLDPSFLTNDFYTSTTSPRYGVDTWQGMLFGGFQQLTGISYALQIAVLTALRHLLFPWVVHAFLRALTKDKAVSLFGAVLGVLAAFALPKTLGWGWVWGDGSPAMFAAISATAAWTCLLYRRVALALILLAVATICQPLVGVHGGIMFALIFFLEFKPEERWKILFSPVNIAAGLVFLAAFLSQYLMLTPPRAERLPDAEYVRILAFERHPTDFLPSRFSRETWACFGIAAAGLALLAVRSWKALPKKPLIVGILVAYGLICVLGSVFVEWIPVRFAADLIPFRTVIISAPVMLLIAALAAARAYRSGDLVTLALLVASFALAGPPAMKLGAPPVAAAGVLLLAGLADLSRVGERATFPRLMPLVWPLATAGLLVIAAAAGYLRLPYMTLPTLANQHPVYAWAKAHTPANAKFLVEQFSSGYAYTDDISPQRMRLIGRRAVAASMDYPFSDRDLRTFMKTWTVGLNHGARDRVETATLPEFRAICRELPFDYVVRMRPLQGLAPVISFPPRGHIGELHVYQPCAGAG